MNFTIFTPTYNRSMLLKRLYNSLFNQSLKNFEWIIVDDGSTDDTEITVNDFIRSSDFKIKYFKVKNGGKCRAWNFAVNKASYKWFIVIDDDDYFLKNAMEIFEDCVSTLTKDDIKICALVTNRMYSNNTLIGSCDFETKYFDCLPHKKKNYNISGDKMEIYDIDILKKYPFPEFDGENFLPESVVFDKIGLDGYKYRFFKYSTTICDYLPDGLTHNWDENLESNPKGYGLFLYYCIKSGNYFGLTKWLKILKYYNSFKNKMSLKEISKNIHVNRLSLIIHFFIFKFCFR